MIKKEKVCLNCQKIINLNKEKYVLLGTYNGSTVLNESYFHFKCWIDYYTSKIKEKATNTLKNAGQKVTGMLSGMRNMAMKNSEGNQEFDLASEIPNMSNEMNWK